MDTRGTPGASVRAGTRYAAVAALVAAGTAAAGIVAAGKVHAAVPSVEARAHRAAIVYVPNAGSNTVTPIAGGVADKPIKVGRFHL
jgi:hypothetical protein